MCSERDQYVNGYQLLPLSGEVVVVGEYVFLAKFDEHTDLRGIACKTHLAHLPAVVSHVDDSIVTCPNVPLLLTRCVCPPSSGDESAKRLICGESVERNIPHASSLSP